MAEDRIFHLPQTVTSHQRGKDATNAHRIDYDRFCLSVCRRKGAKRLRYEVRLFRIGTLEVSAVDPLQAAKTSVWQQVGLVGRPWKSRFRAVQWAILVAKANRVRYIEGVAQHQITPDRLSRGKLPRARRYAKATRAAWKRSQMRHKAAYLRSQHAQYSQAYQSGDGPGERWSSADLPPSIWPSEG